MNYFEIINETNESVIELDSLKDLVIFTLKHQNINNAILNIIIVYISCEEKLSKRENKIFK